MISAQDVVLGLMASCLPSLIAIALLNFSDAFNDEDAFGPRAGRGRDALGSDGCAVDDRVKAIAGQPFHVAL